MADYDQSHPSYGLVGFSRVTGDTGKMFGSALPVHGHFVQLSIKRAVAKHELNRDWYMAREELIRVNLSASQFAELLTTMNVGDGVPCTLGRVAGKIVESVPAAAQTEAEKIGLEFEDRLKQLAQVLAAKAQDGRSALLRKGTLPVAERKQIAGLLSWLIQEVEWNIPDILDSFQRGVAKTVQHAKAELDAVVSHAVHKTGLSVLKRKSPFALVEGEKEERDDEQRDDEQR